MDGTYCVPLAGVFLPLLADAVPGGGALPGPLLPTGVFLSPVDAGTSADCDADAVVVASLVGVAGALGVGTAGVFGGSVWAAGLGGRSEPVLTRARKNTAAATATIVAA